MKSIRSMGIAAITLSGLAFGFAGTAQAGGFLSKLLEDTVKEVVESAEGRLEERRQQQKVKTRQQVRNAVDCLLGSEACRRQMEEWTKDEEAQEE
jgi:hypothetical protein